MGKVERITTPGLNVRWPWSELIVSGEKIVETRSYPIPSHLLNRPIAVIQTGAPDETSASIIGLVRFSSCFEYESKSQWAKDRKRHRVGLEDLDFAYVPGVPKWGWVVDFACRIQPTAPSPEKKGIKFAKACLIPVESIECSERKLRQVFDLALPNRGLSGDVSL